MSNTNVITLNHLIVLCNVQVEATYNLEIRRLRSQITDQEAALKFHEDKNTELQLTVTACSSENDLLRFLPTDLNTRVLADENSFFL